MSRLARLLFFILLVSSTVSCGTNSTRQLQSIIINSTKSGQVIEFVASGSFSAPPTTVTPLAVDWTLGLMAPPPKRYTYALTTEPYMFDCANGGAYSLPVVAFAPTDPRAPRSGTTTKVVNASAPVPCQ